MHDKFQRELDRQMTIGAESMAQRMGEHLTEAERVELARLLSRALVGRLRAKLDRSNVVALADYRRRCHSA